MHDIGPNPCPQRLKIKIHPVGLEEKGLFVPALHPIAIIIVVVPRHSSGGRNMHNTGDFQLQDDKQIPQPAAAAPFHGTPFQYHVRIKGGKIKRRVTPCHDPDAAEDQQVLRIVGGLKCLFDGRVQVNFRKGLQEHVVFIALGKEVFDRDAQK